MSLQGAILMMQLKMRLSPGRWLVDLAEVGNLVITPLTDETPPPKKVRRGGPRLKAVKGGGEGEGTGGPRE